MCVWECVCVWIDLCVEPQRHLVMFISLFLAWGNVYTLVWAFVCLNLLTSNRASKVTCKVLCVLVCMCLRTEHLHKYQFIRKCCHQNSAEVQNSVCACGESRSGRLILNLPFVAGVLRLHLDSVSLCQSCFSLLLLSLSPHLCSPCFYLHFFSRFGTCIPLKKLSWFFLGCQCLSLTCCLSCWTRLSFSLFRAATSSWVFFFLDEESSSRAILASFSLIAARSASCLRRDQLWLVKHSFLLKLHQKKGKLFLHTHS